MSGALQRELFEAVSIVVPCRNEEMNVAPLAAALRAHYGAYIHEILFVDDNSTDGTAEACRALAHADPRIKLLVRQPPCGVGRALRDGYAAAAGRFILSMDCDFVQIVPELGKLFDAVAAGREGAIGSRFSPESVLVGYPLAKIVCNRGFHFLVRLLLPGVRDISNNLKLYRADVFKAIDIEEAHFAANAETGLKPILAGYDIVEVPVSWIGRTRDMGKSSFSIVKLAPDYVRVLARIFLAAWRQRRAGGPQLGGRSVGTR